MGNLFDIFRAKIYSGVCKFTETIVFYTRPNAVPSKLLDRISWTVKLFPVWVLVAEHMFFRIQLLIVMYVM